MLDVNYKLSLKYNLAYVCVEILEEPQFRGELVNNEEVEILMRIILKKMRVLSFTLCFFFISSMLIVPPAQAVTPVNTISITQDATGVAISDVNRSERLKNYQIPKSNLKIMTTEELIETILNYPLLVDLYAYDTYQQGFKAVSKSFNGLEELVLRKDVALKLLAKYKDMEVIKDATKVTSRQFLKLSYMEILLGQDEILSKFNKTETADLQKKAEDKYLQKKNLPNIYGMDTSKFLLKNITKVSPLNTLSSLVYISPLGYNFYNVYTPMGTAVEVYTTSQDLEWSPSEKIALDNDTRNSYPGITILRTATKYYNCHSYAWYSTSYSNLYWMNYPSAYMTDGSYTYKSYGSNYDKVYYNGGDHSGIITGVIVPFHIYQVTSKWGKLGLISHSSGNCPYVSADLKFYY